MYVSSGIFSGVSKPWPPQNCSKNRLLGLYQYWAWSLYYSILHDLYTTWYLYHMIFILQYTTVLGFLPKFFLTYTVWSDSKRTHHWRNAEAWHWLACTMIPSLFSKSKWSIRSHCGSIEEGPCALCMYQGANLIWNSILHLESLQCYILSPAVLWTDLQQ